MLKFARHEPVEADPADEVLEACREADAACAALRRALDARAAAIRRAMTAGRIKSGLGQKALHRLAADRAFAHFGISHFCSTFMPNAATRQPFEEQAKRILKGDDR